MNSVSDTFTGGTLPYFLIPCFLESESLLDKTMVKLCKRFNYQEDNQPLSTNGLLTIARINQSLNISTSQYKKPCATAS